MRLWRKKDEDNTRPKRWGKRFLLAGIMLVGLLLFAWRGLIWYAEKTTAFAGVPQPTCGAYISESRYLQAAEQARAQIQGMLAERQIPGLAAAVAVNGQLVWTEGFGYANRDKRTLACPQTQFRAGSVAKLFTAAALARLYERGKLDLDAPIQRYVPGLPDKGHRITARHLASHRSGIRAYHDDNEALSTRHCNQVSEGLEIFQNDPLLFAPDTDFTYSNYGYVLLSAALEGAAGEDFLSYLRQHVFEPLGMRRTVSWQTGAPLPDESAPYDNVTPYSLDGQVHDSPFIDFSCKWASGGFLSTAEDLVRFGSAHIAAANNGFLKAETLNLLFTPRTSQAGLVGYGLGWMTARDLHLRRTHFHFGAGSGGTAVLAIYPAYRLSVAVVANLGHAKFPFERLMGSSIPSWQQPLRGIA